MTAAWICIIPFVASIGSAGDALPVSAETIEGRSIDGMWAGISDGHAILLDQQDRNIQLPLPDLLSISWPAAITTTATSDTPPASAPATESANRSVLLFLRDGCVIPGQLTAGDAKTISLDTTIIGKWVIPLAQVAAIRFTAIAQPEAQAAFDRALANHDATQDTLLIANESNVQTLRGVTESLDPAAATFRWRQRSMPIPADRAAGLIFAPGTTAARTESPAACHLDDGSIWCGQILASDTDSITLELGVGQQVRFPLRKLREIRFTSSRVTFLDDMEPVKVDFEPFGTTQWPWQRNRSVANRPLRIAGRTFSRGLGVHSRTILTYALTGQTAQLAAIIGIDDGARPRGHVIFRITADNKEVFNSGPVTGHDPPRPILVPLHNAQSLQLIVDFGQDLDLGDQADWCNARIIK